MIAVRDPRSLFTPALTILGAFDPRRLIILLHGAPANIPNLSGSQRGTYSHEFAHLIHYFITYLGYKDLQYWLEIALLAERSLTADEAQLTLLAEEILGVERRRQRLALDSNYYYDDFHAPAAATLQIAASQPDRWHWAERAGRLYNVRGELADAYFWCLRFSIDREGMPFRRVPFGLRIALEHMAKGGDWLFDLRERPPDVAAELARYKAEAFEPRLLDYYALTHRVNAELTKRGNVDWLPRIIATSLLSFLAALVPYDEEDVWASLTDWARRRRLFDESKLSHPHVSWVFPILLDALFVTNEDSLDHIDADRTLAEVGLPSTAQLVQRNVQLVGELRSRPDLTPMFGPVVDVIDYVSDYVNDRSPIELLNGPYDLEDEPPIPVVFQEHQRALPGRITGSDLSHAENMGYLEGRYQEMLGYSYTRNIFE